VPSKRERERGERAAESKSRRGEEQAEGWRAGKAGRRTQS